MVKYGSLAYKIRSIQNKLQLTEREKDLYSEKSDYYQTKLVELEYRMDNKKFPLEDSANHNTDLYKQKRSEYKKNKLGLGPTLNPLMSNKDYEKYLDLEGFEKTQIDQ